MAILPIHHHHPKLSSQPATFLLLIILLIFGTCTAAQLSNIPRLRTVRQTNRRNSKVVGLTAAPSKDFRTYYFKQTLDHFNYKPESFNTFRQRFMVNFKYWGGASSNAPIFAYLGGEGGLDSDLFDAGFHIDVAPRFKALLIYIEHRFYGQSIPSDMTMEEATADANMRGYFTSAQALADYAAILDYVKERLLDAKDCPLIVIGGSYGGMLATWFRLKYPHIALGALASSAPILYFDNAATVAEYYSIVTKDFRETSESCYETIRSTWAEIDMIASTPDGVNTLSKRFKTCDVLQNKAELKNFLDSIFAEAAQYNEPPLYPVNTICSAIDGAPAGTDNLGKILAGIASYRGRLSCYDVNEFMQPTDSYLGWRWQTCSEMVMPIGHGNTSSMFQLAPFDLKRFKSECQSTFDLDSVPQLDWISTYFGGHDMKSTLRRFASNVIFSNGLKDPYSSAGVLDNITDSILAVTTANGSHCLDLHPSRQTDPGWLVAQRKAIADIIDGWLTKCHKDLGAIRPRN